MPVAALKLKNICFLMLFFRTEIWLNRSLSIFSVCIRVAVKLLRDLTELIKYEAICTNITSVRLYSCLSYRTCKSHLFCISFYSRSCGVCLAVPHFPTLSSKRQGFRKNITENKTLVLIFSTAFYWNISHSEINLESSYHKCVEVFTKIPFVFVIFLWHLNFRDRFKKKQYQISLKSFS